MRPIHALLGLVVVLASGASAYVATHLASTEPVARPELSESPAAAPSDMTPALEIRKTQDQVAMLTSQIDELRNELETLRNSANRAPATSLEVAAAAPASVGQVTQLQRETVLAVLEENRQREAAEAEAARAKAEAENAKRRAARVAKELNLSPGDEARLADLMVVERKKGQEMFEAMRNAGDREAARPQFDEFRTWRTDQYTQAFGASIAEQIMQTEGGDRFFGGPGGQGGFAGGGNGGGGGQGARGARRANAPGGGAPGPGGGQTQN